MADVKGSCTLGFSVTPEQVTVVTDQGATVTFVDAGDFIIDSFYTRCGITEDGRYYPIVVDERSSGAAIGSDWEPDTGGNPNATGIDYVKIIDGNGVYVNPQLMPWLTKQGASVQKTFQSCYMTTISGITYSGIQAITCMHNNALETLPHLVTGDSVEHNVYFTTHDGENRVNCEADGFTNYQANTYSVRCSSNQEYWMEFCNYCLLKAMGAPTTIFES